MAKPAKKPAHKPAHNPEMATAPAAPETATAPEAERAVETPAAPAAKAPVIGPPFYSCRILSAHTTANGVNLIPGSTAVLGKATIEGEHLIERNIIAAQPRLLA